MKSDTICKKWLKCNGHNIISEPELFFGIGNYNLQKKLISRQLWRHRTFISWEFLSLTDQLHGCNYRSEKKISIRWKSCTYQFSSVFTESDIFLHNICWNELQRWIQHSFLDQQAIWSTFSSILDNLVVYWHDDTFVDVSITF